MKLTAHDIRLAHNIQHLIYPSKKTVAHKPVSKASTTLYYMSRPRNDNNLEYQIFHKIQKSAQQF